MVQAAAIDAFLHMNSIDDRLMGVSRIEFSLHERESDVVHSFIARVHHHLPLRKRGWDSEGPSGRVRD